MYAIRSYYGDDPGNGLHEGVGEGAVRLHRLEHGALLDAGDPHGDVDGELPHQGEPEVDVGEAYAEQLSYNFV